MIVEFVIVPTYQQTDCSKPHQFKAHGEINKLLFDIQRSLNSH